MISASSPIGYLFLESTAHGTLIEHCKHRQTQMFVSSSEFDEVWLVCLAFRHVYISDFAQSDGQTMLPWRDAVF